MLRLLAQTVSSSAIIFNLAPFGKIAYGRTLSGVLHFEDFDFCSPPLFDREKISKEFPPVFIAHSSDCPMKTQALNMQQKGALWGIIVVPNGFMKESLIHESRDGANIELPILIVEESQGNKLIEMAKSGDFPLKLQIAIPKRDNVSINFLIKIEDQPFYDFIFSMKNYIDQFDYSLEVDFSFYKEAVDDINAARLVQTTDCIGSNEIFEDLLNFKKNCLANYIKLADCFQAQVDPKTARTMPKCMDSKVDQTQDDLRNMILETPQAMSHGIINGLKYDGNLNPEDVYEAICSAYLRSPDNCLYLNDRYIFNMNFKAYKKQNSNNKYIVYVLIAIIEVILLAIVALILSMIYGKIYKGIVYEKVPDIVKDSIIMYRSFSKDNSKTNV